MGTTFRFTLGMKIGIKVVLESHFATALELMWLTPSFFELTFENVIQTRLSWY